VKYPDYRRQKTKINLSQARVVVKWRATVRRSRPGIFIVTWRAYKSRSGLVTNDLESVSIAIKRTIPVCLSVNREGERWRERTDQLWSKVVGNEGGKGCKV